MKTLSTLKQVLLFVCLSFIFSCKKNDAGRSTVSTKIKTYIEDLTNVPPYNRIDSFTVSYDADGRIVSNISTTSTLQFLFSYNGTTSATVDIMNNNQLTIREFSYLNSDQKVDSTFQYNDTDDSSTTKLIYNANGQVAQELFYDYSLPGGAVMWKKNNYTYDANGNLATDTEIMTASGNTNLIITYTYNTIEPNWYSLWPTYRQRLPKNCPITATYFYPGSGTTETVNTTYTFDNDNRIISETQTDSYGNVAVKKYIYY
ncbi:MAG: hypothetical protein QM737_18175 [Ferruginibacter sp.]